MLLPPDLRDWLEDDHIAWFVIDAVAELDLEVVDRIGGGDRTPFIGRRGPAPRRRSTLASGRSSRPSA
jgi:hypothetical protein